MIVFTLTTDGYNSPTDTQVFATKGGARAALIAALKSYDVTHDEHGRQLADLPTDTLCTLWEAAADGACILEAQEVLP
jgi:hypothetical protein